MWVQFNLFALLASWAFRSDRMWFANKGLKQPYSWALSHFAFWAFRYFSPLHSSLLFLYFLIKYLLQWNLRPGITLHVMTQVRDLVNSVPERKGTWCGWAFFFSLLCVCTCMCSCMWGLRLTAVTSGMILDRSSRSQAVSVNSRAYQYCWSHKPASSEDPVSRFWGWNHTWAPMPSWHLCGSWELVSVPQDASFALWWSHSWLCSGFSDSFVASWILTFPKFLKERLSPIMCGRYSLRLFRMGVWEM